MGGVPTPRSEWHAPDGAIYPLVDADASIYVTLSPEDVKNGVPEDPTSCAIACGVKRAADAPVVMIGKSIAYVVLRRNGRYLAFRFRVAPATRRAIDLFDKTGSMPVEAMLLEAPQPSNRLDSQRAQGKRTRLRWAQAGKPPAKRRRRSRPLSSTRNASPLANTMVVKRHEVD